MTVEILPSDIEYIQVRQKDNVGEVFRYNGKLLRGVFPSAKGLVDSLFSTGLISKLTEEQLFPGTKISQTYRCSDYVYILEHDEIWPVTYPHEWTFSMLKRAAVVVLQVAEIARQYGFNMKDCHGLNVLFDRGSPKFIDFGSFYREQSSEFTWHPYREFLSAYYYPLYIWQHGQEFTAKMSIFAGQLIPAKDHYLYRYSTLRSISENLLDKLIKLRFLPHDLTRKDDATIDQALGNKALRSFAKLLQIFGCKKYGGGRDLKILSKKLHRLKRPKTQTLWNTYHGDISKKAARFDRIVDLINDHCSSATSAIDIAGNQGKFSHRLLSETNLNRVVCQDLDEEALDQGFITASGKALAFANYNAMSPILKQGMPAPAERLKSDLVVCLALTHHLLLSQGYKVEKVLHELSKYTSEFICIEFMPKGLWTYGSPVAVPDWYSEKWFEEAFVERYQLLVKEAIAENYVVFVGRAK